MKRGQLLRLGRQEYGADDRLIMAIVNRTPDSFYDRGATFAFDKALERVEQCVTDGAEIVDIGGVKAAPGADVDADEEIARTADFIAQVRAAYPELIISVDTWRHEVARAACGAGADILNDAWGGHDPKLAEVAAEFGVAIVCTHTGGVAPRTRPHRIEYDDVVADTVSRTVALAERAQSLGVDPNRILIDPGHDFGKNTRHSLEVTRRLGEMIDTGWPVLVSLSNKDFVGETLDVPLDQRLLGTLATTSVCSWLGAMVYRAHNIPETRQTLDMVAAIQGTRAPRATVRGLA
jgi:dihydropteroate synthase